MKITLGFLTLLSLMNLAAAGDGFSNGAAGIAGGAHASHTGIGEESQNLVGMDLGAKGHLFMLSYLKDDTLLLMDGHFTYIVGFNAPVSASTDAETTYRVKLMGGLTIAMRRGSLMPAFGLSVDDYQKEERNQRNESKSLIGTTILIPLPVLSNIAKKRSVYVSLTAGFRNNEQFQDADHIAETTHQAVQTKLHVEDPRVNLDVRYLRSWDNPVGVENRVVGHFDVNNVFLNGDQLGVQIERESLDFNNPTAKDYSYTEGMALYVLPLSKKKEENQKKTVVEAPANEENY
jgi:hypothetical protein